MASDDKQLSTVSRTGQLQSIEIVVEKPDHVDGTRDKALQSQASEVVGQFMQGGLSNQQLIDKVGFAGLEAQNKARNELQLFSARIDQAVKKIDDAQSFPKTIQDVRHALDEINVHEIGKGNRFVRILNSFFLTRWIGTRFLPAAAKVLQMVAAKIDTVRDVLNGIESGLYKREDVALKDNQDLMQMFDNMQIRRRAVRENAYLCQLISVGIRDQVLPAVRGNPIDERIAVNVLNTVSRRAATLVTIDQVFSQRHLIIHETIQGNRELILGIHEMVTLVIPIVEDGIGLKVAQYHSAQTAQALAGIRKFASETHRQTMQDMITGRERIDELMANPMLDLGAVRESFDLAMQHIKRQEELKTSQIQRFQQTISQMSKMTGELDAQLQSLTGALSGKSTRPQSLEVVQTEEVK